MSKIKNPHDKYFQSAMSNIKIAKDFFRQHLPKEFRREVDLNTLKLEKASYIDKELKKLMSDILYSAQIDGDEGYLYLLIEHQSKGDRMMPFRLLEYSCRIMRRDISNGKKFLPVVIPLVLYNGDVRYPYEHDIFYLFPRGVQRKLAKNTLCKPFQLVDLSEMTDMELNTSNWSSIMLMLMKHIYSRELLGVIESISEKLNIIYENEGKDYVYTSMNYVLSAGNLEKLEDLSDILNNVSSDMGEDIMTIAERLITQGREEGITQGIAQGISQGISQGINQGINRGISKGITEGIKKTAINMLREGIDLIVISRVTGLTIKEIEQLQEKSSDMIS